MSSPPPLPVNDDTISRAVTALAGGKLVIVPTDTVYGIAADARRDRAAARIPIAKGRPGEMPLQLLFADSIDLVDRYARLSRSAVKLVDVLGPGPWTIVCRAVPTFRSPALGGGATVGFRIPDTPLIHRMVERLGGPLAASSANRHGRPSPRTCDEAVLEVGAFCAVALDGGACPVGVDSTVIDCSEAEPRILREGAIARDRVARILGLSEIPVVRTVR